MPDVRVPLKQSVHNAELGLAEQMCGWPRQLTTPGSCLVAALVSRDAYLDNIKRVHYEGGYDGGTASCNTPFLQRELTA